MRQHHIEIRPNSSLSGSSLPLVFGVIALPVVMLTVISVILGYWYPLPFAVLELAALAWGFRYCQKRSKYRELIIISEDRIIIQRGTGFPGEKIELPKHWTQVKLEPATDRLKPNKLVVSTGMQRYVVASCLTDSERIGLWERLNHLIGPVCHTPSDC